jgi:hypothetical protein
MALPIIAYQAGITAGLWGLNKLSDWINGRPQLPHPRPQEMDFAQARIGAPIPLVYGTIRVDNAVLVDVINRGNTEVAGAGVLRYGASMLFVIGMPPDADFSIGATAPVLKRMWYGDAEVSITGVGAGITHQNFRTFACDLGGPVGGGTGGFFAGRIEFFDGRNDQLITSSPAAPSLQVDLAYERAGNDRSLIPGYRRQMLAYIFAEPDTKVTVGAGDVFASTGESNTVSNIAFEAAATGRQPVGTFAEEANPAWTIFDLMTRTVGGLAIPLSDIDTPSFAAAASTLEAEGNGCSLAIFQEQPAPQIFDVLLNQTDGALYVDPSDGKIHFRLARADWNPLTAREINADNTVGFPQISTTSLDDVASQVRVTFTNRGLDYKDDVAIDQRISNAVGQDGRVNSIDVHMPAVCTAAQAAKMAARELNSYGRPRLTIKCNVSRELADLKILDVVKVNYSKRSIVNVFMRVLRRRPRPARGRQGRADARRGRVRSRCGRSRSARPLDDNTPQRRAAHRAPVRRGAVLLLQAGAEPRARALARSARVGRVDRRRHRRSRPGSDDADHRRRAGPDALRRSGALLARGGARPDRLQPHRRADRRGRARDHHGRPRREGGHTVRRDARQP